MSRIDYSKWDKLDEYDDLSDDDEDGRGGSSNNHQQPRPRVTRLDQPSTVTRTATGEILIQDATVVTDASSSPPKAKNSVVMIPAATTKDASSSASSVSRASDTARSDGGSILSPCTAATIPTQWTEKGGSCDYKGTTLHWSQDRTTITLHLRLPPAAPSTLLSTTSRSSMKPTYKCTVTHLLPYNRRDSAVSSHDRSRLRVVELTGDDARSVIVVDGELTHPVHANQEDDDDEYNECNSDVPCEVDWNIERIHDNEDENGNKNESKYMVIALNKATPMSGMTLWWKQPFVDAPEISNEQWKQDRDESSQRSATAFAQAWKEAHEQFREKIKHQRPHELDE